MLVNMGPGYTVIGYNKVLTSSLHRKLMLEIRKIMVTSLHIVKFI